MTDEVTRMMPEGMPSPYRLGSGAAHGRPWMLERSSTELPCGEIVGEGATALTAAFTAIYCMQSWVAAWGGYFGVDVADQITDLREMMKNLALQGSTLT